MDTLQQDIQDRGNDKLFGPALNGSKDLDTVNVLRRGLIAILPLPTSFQSNPSILEALDDCMKAILARTDSGISFEKNGFNVCRGNVLDQPDTCVFLIRMRICQFTVESSD